MTTAVCGLLDDLAALLAYPRDGFRASSGEVLQRLRTEAPEARAALEPFAAAVAARSDAELEELYTQTFDLNPSCALEIGWHLFGEDYARGAFLAEMRGRLRRLGVDEGGELPDYLPRVLAVLGRSERGQGRELALSKVLPALDKMDKAMAGNPYEGVLRAVRLCLDSRYAAAAGGMHP